MKLKSKTGKDRLDKYYHLAKKHGYRSRSAFKIIQLAKRYNFFQDCNVLVDLCAAPGGWLQVASKQLPISSIIIGVDLAPIKPIKGVITFQSDIRTAKCRSLIMNQLKGMEADVVLHDGSPNMGCNWNIDAFNQNVLVLEAAKLAASILRPGGTFVTKIFRSADYNSLIWMLSNCFDSIKVTKPQSSRNVSAEIFAICIGFKTLKGLDPRLFNCDYVFLSDKDKVPEVNNKSLNQLLKEQKKIRREGYEPGSDFSEASVLDFLKSDGPANVLLSNNRLLFNVPKDSVTFEEDTQLLKSIVDCSLTTDEVKLLCSDLKVAGKGDLQYLLKWRMKLIKEFPKILPEKVTPSVNVDIVELDEEKLIEKEREKLENTMEHNRKRLERRQKKLLRKRRITGRSTALVSDEPELFHLNTLNGNDPDTIPYSTDTDSEISELEFEETDDYGDDKVLQMDVDLEVQHSLRKLAESERPKTNSKLTRRQRSNMEKSSEVANLVNNLQYEAKLEALNQSDSDTEHEDVVTKRWFDQDIFKDEPEQILSKLKRNKKKGDDTIELVPAISDADLESNNFIAELNKDDDAISEVQAMGSLLISKKTRMDLLDGAYNKRTFDDGDLPSWFVEDESKHNKPEYPVSGELMRKFKSKLLEIRNRPIRKVLEARSRKKARMQKKLKSILPKVESMANDSSKPSNANKLIRKVKNITSAKRDKVYVVSRKSGISNTSQSFKSGSRKTYKAVDRRLKKDKRKAKKSRGKSRKIRPH